MATWAQRRIVVSIEVGAVHASVDRADGAATTMDEALCRALRCGFSFEIPLSACGPRQRQLVWVAEEEIDAEPEAIESRATETPDEPDEAEDLGVFKDFLNSLDLDDLGDE